MEELLKILQTSRIDSKQRRDIYQTVGEIQGVGRHKESYFLFECIFPRLHELHHKSIIAKDIMYLSLLSYENINMLQLWLKYDKSIHRLNVENAKSLYNYCIFKRNHWFQKVVLNCDKYLYVSYNSYNKTMLLQLLHLTNLSVINFEVILQVLNKIEDSKIELFWSYYLKQMKTFIRVLEFCSKYVTSTIDQNELFLYLKNNSILRTFSRYLDLSTINLEDILVLLNENKDDCNGHIDSDHFVVFKILVCILKCVTEPDTLNLSEAVSWVRGNILMMNNKSMQVNILKNIFVVIFIKSSYFYNKHFSRQYLCLAKQIRLILYLLKEVIDMLMLKNIYDKQLSEFKELSDLNKHVKDAMWRMDIIQTMKDESKCEINLLSYMLAPPDSLIQMCLNRQDIEKAYQVIRISTQFDTNLQFNIVYSEKMLNFRHQLQKQFRVRAIRKENPQLSSSNIKISIEQIIEEFFKNNPVYVDSDLTEMSNNYDFFHHFENEVFLAIFDLAVTLPNLFEDFQLLLHIAFKNNTLSPIFTSSYSVFCKKVQDICNVNKKCACEVLLSPFFANVESNNSKKTFLSNIAEVFNEMETSLKSSEFNFLSSNHPSHKLLLKLNKLCIPNTIQGVKYISKLFNYLKAFSKIFFNEEDTSGIVASKNSSYFDLLAHNRAEMIGKLVFEKKHDLTDFEKYFGVLKLDYLYHIIGNCFPTINLYTKENLTEAELYHENYLYVPNNGVINYIQKRNWLLAFLLNEIYKIEDVVLEVNQARLRVFSNYLNLERIQFLKELYDHNIIITALQNEVSYQKLKNYIDGRILVEDYLIQSTHSNDSFETGEEILEDALKTTNWVALEDILKYIPECQLKKTPEFHSLRDNVLMNVIHDSFEISFYKYVRYISNDDMRAGTILDYMTKWPANFCESVLKSEITKYNIIQDSIFNTTLLIRKIQLSEEISKYLRLESWSLAYHMCETNSDTMIMKLAESGKVKTLLEFILLYKPTSDSLCRINETYFKETESYEYIKLLFNHMTKDHSVKICYSLLKTVKNLDYLQFIVSYLLDHTEDESLKKVSVSLEMLTVFPQSERDLLLCLIYEPTDIIETLIMNTKLDKLATVLDILKSLLPYPCVSEKIDQILRIYAEKSLDFRVITQPNPRLLHTPECKLMQSLDSLSINFDSRGFVMPEQVPKKEEWVDNYEVLVCMCCHKVSFSMFNRRHHCRRCGRVICYSCSLQRMLVPTYGTILVRVCKDCYCQTIDEESNTSEVNDSISTKTIINEYWFLTDDPHHNRIVREEFSYDHAPSVSLCLSLMKFHSKRIDYPKFLLDQCNVMLKLILPSQEPIQEIDYLLVIKMLKSLTVAAKMASINCSYPQGSSLADRILSQAELLSLLVERGCFNLLPVSNTYPRGGYVDASVLRKLRDRLLEREQWNLALEVSMKAGLDSIGIFAAWGKCCLKAGSLLLARDKFQRCFEKTGFCENTLESSLGEQVNENSSRFRNLTAKSFIDAKPLLDEIIYILETSSQIIGSQTFQMSTKQKLVDTPSFSKANLSIQDAATCVLNKLKSLKDIREGIYQSTEVTKEKDPCTKASLDQTFFEECIFYLKRYGSHLSLLEFYIKHGHFEDSLHYILDNQLSSEVFVDIYMRCLKNGLVLTLQENMSKIDSSLEVWKDYLRSLCRHLEKQNMLHSLYQLQQYIGDYIRAAMTCIRFYQENITCFRDLVHNVPFLHKAEEHLQQGMMQEQWIEVAPIPKLSAVSEDCYEEKGIVNHSLIMKMLPRDIYQHINTMQLQDEIVTFLADCEHSERKPLNVLHTMDLTDSGQTAAKTEANLAFPTLFGTVFDKICLAVLVIVCGNNAEDGFNLAQRIIQEFKLKPIKIYCEAGKHLAKVERYGGIAQLVNCIKQTDDKDNNVSDMCDAMLMLATATFTKANVSGTKVEELIKLISDKSAKISAYIEAKQLKTAYFLAVKYRRMSDIRRISREAELLNQPSIKALCQKVLHSNSHTPILPKD